MVPVLLRLVGRDCDILIEKGALCEMFVQVLCFCSTACDRIEKSGGSTGVMVEEEVWLRLRHVVFGRASTVSDEIRPQMLAEDLLSADCQLFARQVRETEHLQVGDRASALEHSPYWWKIPRVLPRDKAKKESEFD